MNFWPAYPDRRAAGRALAERLQRYRDLHNVVVLGLPRGGVPVAYEVARALRAPLDAFTVRKLGVPGHEELAMGAVASGGIVVVDHELVHRLHVSRQQFDTIVNAEEAELTRREAAYRDHRPLPEFRNKTLIVVDDGLATGASMKAAVEALRRRNPAAIVVAVPVGDSDTCAQVTCVADDVVCLLKPPIFHAVGLHYGNFRQTTDDEVRTLLNAAAEERKAWRVA